jgi:ketosteroid isomerase-like protein
MTNVRDSIVRGDFESFLAVLDPRVVWQGLEERQICRNRDEVRQVFEDHMSSGRSGYPEVVAETSNALVVDPHVDPPLPGQEELHHVFVVREGLIVRMEDHADRASALAAVGLE